MIGRSKLISRALAGAAMFVAILAPSFASAQQTLKIGGIGSLTGGGSAWGLAIQRGAQLAIDEVRSRGGLKVGGKSYLPELLMYDDSYTGQGGKTAMERLLFQDKVSFVVGPIGSPAVLGVVGALDEARTNSGVKAIALTNGASLEILKNKYSAPYNFLICNTNREYAPSVIRWLKQKHPELKKVAIVAPNDAVGQTVVPALIDAYKNAGIEVWFEMYERGTKEFTPLMTRMIAAGVDAFDMDNNSPGDSGLLFKQARQAGFRGLIWQTGGPAVEEVIGAGGKLADGFLSYDLFDFNSEEAKPLVAAYRAKYGSGIINAFMPIFYNATQLLFAAIEKSDSLDVTKVRDTMEGLDGSETGIFGKVKWGGKEVYGVNHQLELPFLVVEVVNGKGVPRATLRP
jgi:branched-chain amino acid transport system substrate-binding protein